MAKKEYDVELEIDKTLLMDSLNMATGSFANTLQDGAITFEKDRIIIQGINTSNYACAMIQLNKTDTKSYKAHTTVKKGIDTNWLKNFKKHLSSGPKQTVTLQIENKTLHIRMGNIHKKAIWIDTPDSSPVLGAFKEGGGVRKYADNAPNIGTLELPEIMKFMHAAAHNHGDGGRPVTITIQKGKATIETEIETGDTLAMDLTGISDFKKGTNYRAMFPADDLNELLRGIHKLAGDINLAGTTDAPLIITANAADITKPGAWAMLAPRIETE